MNPQTDNISTQKFLDEVNSVVAVLRSFASDPQIRPEHAAAMKQGADHLADVIKEALAFCFLSTVSLASKEVRDGVSDDLAEINAGPKTVQEIRDAVIKYLVDHGI